MEHANRLARLAVVLHDAFDAIVMTNLEGRVLAWNPAAERMYGWSEAQALKLTLQERVPAAALEQTMARLKLLSQAQVIGPITTQRLTCSGAVVNISLVATPLVDAKGRVYAISATERLQSVAE
ncbi:MAG: PAS domain S-box protein [Rhodoferax sp.]|nr:PAS domain S-box protein [Rhodoferax sp.]